MEGESADDYAARLAAELEQKIIELGPETVAGFVAETVVGATLGAVPPVANYFRRVRAVCDKYGVLLIQDEVMSGTGRTGHLFACEEDEIVPDIVAIAKGLGGGYQPIGAILVAGHVYQAVVEGSGFFQHGHTYLAHSIACAAALEVQKTIEEEDLLSNVRARGDQLESELKERFAQHPYVGDIRGRGLLRGVEIVENRETKAPFDPSRRIHSRIKSEGMARGLMTYPMGGTIDGRRGDHVMLAPPFICTAGEISQIADLLCASIDAATRAEG